MKDVYQQAGSLAAMIEAELKALNRWDSEPLPREKYENMGAFGSNTMTFEQWLQFILMPRMKEIIEEKGEFPRGSMLGAYAMRVFGADPHSGQLHKLLYELDQLVNGMYDIKVEELPDEAMDPRPTIAISNRVSDTVSLGDTVIPSVLVTLADVLPDFEGDDLESQLETYDSFLTILSPMLRPAISDLLKQAAEKSPYPLSRSRMEKAARSVANGGRAAAPYDHTAAMNKYREEHKRSFPKS